LDIVKVLDGNTIDLEGHAINIIEAGQSDTYDSTFVHIPDLNMVVAGDVCYNELHQWLAEALDEDKRNAWIAALEKIISLKPATVIASHKRPGAVDGINNVYATIGYIKAFGECKADSSNAEELYHKMLARYPQRINPIILWIASQANFPESG
jgi:glyoxylase-like metal-dependent hydrolase (beta-lactamase superfamily II)